MRKRGIGIAIAAILGVIALVGVFAGRIVQWLLRFHGIHS